MLHPTHKSSDEKTAFSGAAMDRLRGIADAADGWPVIVGVPGEKFIHPRVIEYSGETDLEKRLRLALLAMLKQKPSRNYFHPRAAAIDGDNAAPAEEVSEIPF